MARNLSAIDQFSVVSLPVSVLFNEIELSIATAFVWQDSDQPYLVTNWHVVSGRNFETGATLHKQAAEPNILRVFFTVRGNLGGRGSFEIPLRNEDGEPRWRVHPRRGHKVDVAVLPLPAIPGHLELHPMNRLKQHPIRYGVASDVFVVGYPMGLNAFPIWKRGTIAAEPNLSYFGENPPPFLIDSATRQGLSGSPVILREQNYVDERTNIMEMGSIGSRFIGVYSGRYAPRDPLEAQIGMVWPDHLLTEIIGGQRRETSLEARHFGPIAG